MLAITNRVSDSFADCLTSQEPRPGEPFAGNALSLGRAVLCNAAFPKTADKIAALGYEVSTIGISEFMKADAALTCPSILLD